MSNDTTPPDSSDKQPIDTVDCYAAGDRAFMQWGQQLRHQLLAPILRLLIALNVTANHLTCASLAAGFAFAWLFPIDRALGFFALALHVVLDGIDGPLARAKGTASKRGSFTDTAADQLVVLLSALVFIQEGMLGVVPGMIYVFAYTIAVGFSMVRNALGIPYSWLVRPRFVVYLWAIVEAYFFPETLSIIVWIANCLLAWKVWTGFQKIRQRL